MKRREVIKNIALGGFFLPQMVSSMTSVKDNEFVKKTTKRKYKSFDLSLDL